MGGGMRIKPVRIEEFAGLMIKPDNAAPGWSLVLHGYGGCKEEMLPLSLFLAGKGIPVLAADLPGHGESGGLFDYSSASKCLASWQGFMKGKPLVAIGHSIGGRLALSLDLPVSVAISPPLSAHFGSGKKEMIRVLRPRRVRETSPFSGLVGILNVLGPGLPVDSDRKRLLLYAEHDLSAVKEAVAAAPPDCYAVKEIKHSDHHDILTSRETWDLTWLWLEKKVINGRSVFSL